MTMPTNTIKTRTDCPDCRRHRFALVVIFIASLASGFCSSSLLHQDRVRAEGRRQFEDFLLNADSLGIIDHARLAELAADPGDEDAVSKAR